jgi:hypothetical protein
VKKRLGLWEGPAFSISTGQIIEKTSTTKRVSVQQMQIIGMKCQQEYVATFGDFEIWYFEGENGALNLLIRAISWIVFCGQKPDPRNHTKPRKKTLK